MPACSASCCACLAAAKVHPDDYKAIVLEGSSTGKPFAAEGDPTWPKNMALVFSAHDEFSMLMWGVPTAGEVVKSEKLKKVFGVEILLPPSNLTRYLPPEPILSLVKRVDVAIEAHFPWNRLGDHFLAVYTRI